MRWLSFIRRPRNSLGALVFGISLCSVVVHPFGRVKAAPDQAQTGGKILSTADVRPEVRAIIERSCISCHSNDTAWPWYSYVAPMSWLIEGDVRNARARMNFSRWEQYNLDQKQQLLADIAAVVRNRKMPLPRYTILHPTAKLSAADVNALYQWARTERRRVKGALTASASEK